MVDAVRKRGVVAMTQRTLGCSQIREGELSADDSPSRKLPIKRRESESVGAALTAIAAAARTAAAEAAAA